MARANLTVQPSLIEAFSNAQDTRDVRIIKVGIDIESETLVMKQSYNVSSTSHKSDFVKIVTDKIVTETSSSFLLFCLSDFDEVNASESLKWLLITWIPDNCEIREKMLFSSSKSDLKTALGN